MMGLTYLKYYFSGFFVKVIAGLDDSMIHIPIVETKKKTRLGRIAFAIGIFMAISVAVAISLIFASTIKRFTFQKYISAILIFGLSIFIYLDIIVHKPKHKVEEKLKKKRPPTVALKESDKQPGLVKKIKKISLKRFIKLIGIGFITAFATVIDDTIAYSSLFFAGALASTYVIIGILSAEIIMLFIIVRFAKPLSKVPFKKEITSIGLFVLGILILFGFI